MTLGQPETAHNSKLTKWAHMVNDKTQVAAYHTTIFDGQRLQQTAKRGEANGKHK